MVRTITIVRHAKQTAPGTLDPPILPITDVPTYEFDYIFSSPFLRCRQTAKLLNKSNKLHYTDARLSEFIADRRVPGTYDFITLNDSPIPTSNNETYAQFTARLDSMLEFINKYVPGNVLIVTHGLAVKYFDDVYGLKRYTRGRDVPYMDGVILEYPEWS